MSSPSTTPSPERGAIRNVLNWCRERNNVLLSIDDVSAARDELAALEAENSALRARLAAAEADTKRLDWLDDDRDTLFYFKDTGWNYGPGAGVDCPSVREAIDAARVSTDASKERKE